MARGKITPKKKIYAARKLYQEGESYTSISNSLGISYQTARNICTCKVHANVVNTGSNGIDKNVVLRICERLNSGVAQKDIVKEFGVSKDTVSGIKRGKHYSSITRGVLSPFGVTTPTKEKVCNVVEAAPKKEAFFNKTWKKVAIVFGSVVAISTVVSFMI